MKTLPVIALLLAVTGAGAQTLPTTAPSVRSVSGQFIVAALPVVARRAPVSTGVDSKLLRLEPTLVAVSAERIKQAVWRELGITGAWEQKVFISLRQARQPDEMVTLVSERVSGQWRYRLEMPDVLPRERYMRALVQVVLLEFANRSAAGKPAEVPVWLTEGIAFHLICNNSAELVLAPPRFEVNGVTVSPIYSEFRRVSPLEKAHKVLIGTSPLTFEELSWPVPGHVEGQGGPKYQASAQLFTWELLKLRAGQRCMREFLRALPEYMNWQLAFLRGFGPHFQRPLDVEKWWALQATEFAGRDLTNTWPFEQSWAKLAAALVEQADVFVSTNQLPARTELTLQEIIREWDKSKQEVVLRRKAVELGSLRQRIAPELMTLTSGYAETLDEYLRQLDPPTLVGINLRALTGRTRVVQLKALQRLGELDAHLERLRPKAAPGDSHATAVGRVDLLDTRPR
jgi:hypothetical protein